MHNEEHAAYEDSDITKTLNNGYQVMLLNHF